MEDDDVVTHLLRNTQLAIVVVITEASTTVAHTLMYRIVCGEAFGTEQLVSLRLYDSPEFAPFLESSMIEITACAPNILHEITYSINPAVAFQGADVVFAIGRARGHGFSKEEHSDLFFKESVAVAKVHLDSPVRITLKGEAIDCYAKKDVKVIILGFAAARVIWNYACSIPTENFSIVTHIVEKITASHVAAKAHRHPSGVKNLIVWGASGKKVYPDCRHAKFQDGATVFNIIDNTWIKKDLVNIVRSETGKSWYNRSTAYAMAEHCKALWCGTAEGEWISMGVMADNFYGIPNGIFFSVPVRCENGKYKVVQGLHVDAYVQRQLKEMAEAMQEEVSAAMKFCCECSQERLLKQ